HEKHLRIRGKKRFLLSQEKENMKILVIDNYDSFTYNLVHYLEDLNCEVTVLRNDKLNLEDVEPFDKIVLSPGPGIPDEAGLLKRSEERRVGKECSNECV